MQSFKFDSINNRYIFKGNLHFLIISAVTMFMAYSGIRMIIEILLFSESYTGADIFGLAFLCVWSSLVLAGMFFGLANATKRVIITTQSVICKTLFSKKEYLWSEIEDWGISYNGDDRGESIYELYFAKEQQPVKKFRKRLKGKMIRTFFHEADYALVVSEVVPFCRSRTSIEPFIARNKVRFYD